MITEDGISKISVLSHLFIMSIIRIAVFTIFSSFALFEVVQTFRDEPFTLAKYWGVWYQVGLLRPVTFRSRIDCEWFVVKPQYECSDGFRETYGKLLNGNPQPKTTGNGTFDDSVMEVSYPDFGHESFTYMVTSQNNGNVLILREKNNVKNSKMLSRNSSVSVGIEMVFESLARTAGLKPVFVHPGDCPR